MDKFNKLKEVISSAPVGGVKEDFTIKTLGEIFTDKAINAIVKHLIDNGYGEASNNE